MNTGNFGNGYSYIHHLYRETVGSLKFPNYPFEYMPWSKTTVVTTSLVMACSGLLPSVLPITSAFTPPRLSRRLSFNDHKNTLFEAQYTAYILDHARLRTPVTGFTLGLFF